jgi:hypothetical protein
MTLVIYVFSFTLTLSHLHHLPFDLRPCGSHDPVRKKNVILIRNCSTNTIIYFFYKLPVIQITRFHLASSLKERLRVDET